MAEAAANVVEIKEKTSQRTIDLRQDNRIVTVLEELEDASNAMAEAKKRYAAARVEILEKMGDARTALVEGWRLNLTRSFVKEHMVKAFTMTRLSARRKGKKKEKPIL